ncbi:MAG: GAF domain-containing protein [Spirochaetes bacterium]|nr:GAF domain-containing protein [Spirochaetota bacterium]
MHVADRATGGLLLLSHKRFPRSFVDNFAYYPADSPRARIMKEIKPTYGHYTEVFNFTDKNSINDDIRGAAIIPVKYRGELVAVLNLASNTYNEIPVKARTTLEAIAAQIGGVIARVRVEEEKEVLIVELKDALDKVKILSGLIPICANCKKIRDDKGYWTQVEDYVRAHSEAKFSHGICPECMKKLYPDFIHDI